MGRYANAIQEEHEILLQNLSLREEEGNNGRALNKNGISRAKQKLKKRLIIIQKKNKIKK